MTGETEGRREGSRAAGICVWACSWALAFTAVWLSLAFGLPREPMPGLVLSTASAELRTLFPAIGFTVALVYGPVAALLLFRRVNAVGVILAVHALGSALGCFGTQWALLGAQTPGLPLWGLLAFASGWSYIPGTFMTAVLPVLVTRARIPRWQRGLVLLGAMNAGMATLASLVQQSVAVPRNPLAIDVAWLQSLLPAAYLVCSFVAVGFAWVSAGILLGRWIRARGRGRTGLAWLAIGHLFLSGSYSLLVLPAGAPVPDVFVGFGLAAPVLGQVIYPAAILVVVLGQGLWGQRVVVSRIILWALLTISGVGLYVAIVLTAPRLLPWPEGLGFVVPLLIAIAIEPVRGWIQRRIDQLIYGEGADPRALLTRLSEQVGEFEAGPAGLRELCEAIRQVLRLASVRVSVASREGGGTAFELGAGSAVGEPERIPLPGSAGRAALVVSAPGGQRLDRRTLSVLRDISGLVAGSLKLVESGRDLDAAREDFFARRAEERRRIQRELHDGLGPALAGAGFGLAAAARLLETDPGGAERLLSEIEDDLARRARAVRSLAHEVSPSPLDGAPLSLAVADLAERFRTDRMAVRVVFGAQPERLDALPQRHQDAIYLIVAESLTNSARHSGAGEVSIELRVNGERAMVQVADDGNGLPHGYRAGIGISSLHRRAVELGGRLQLDSPRGARVTAVLPLDRMDAAASVGEDASADRTGTDDLVRVGHPPVETNSPEREN